MNRSERRRAKKQKPAYLRKSPQEITKQLIQNGITVKDLEENYAIGFTAGFRQAGEPVVKGCFAAICLALHEAHGFGAKRCYDILRRVDQHLLTTLSSDEAIEDVYKQIGLKLDFNEPFDRVQQV